MKIEINGPFDNVLDFKHELSNAHIIRAAKHVNNVLKNL